MQSRCVYTIFELLCYTTLELNRYFQQQILMHNVSGYKLIGYNRIYLIVRS